MSIEHGTAHGERPLANPGPVLAMAALGVIAAVILAFSMFRDPGMPAHLSDSYMRVAGDVVTAEIAAGDATELSARLAGGPAGAVRVPALASLGYRLEGGGTVELGSTPAAIAIYRNPLRDLIVWHAFTGDVAALPGTADVRDDGGRSFHLHYKAATIIAAWQQGRHVVTITSTLPAEQVMAIARVAAGRP